MEELDRVEGAEEASGPPRRPSGRHDLVEVIRQGRSGPVEVDAGRAVPSPRVSLGELLAVLLDWHGGTSARGFRAGWPWRRRRRKESIHASRSGPDPPARRATSARGVQAPLGQLEAQAEGLPVELLGAARHARQDRLLDGLLGRRPSTGGRSRPAPRCWRRSALAELLARHPHERDAAPPASSPRGLCVTASASTTSSPPGFRSFEYLSQRLLRQREQQVEVLRLRVVDLPVGDDDLGPAGAAAGLGAVGLALGGVLVVVDRGGLGEDLARPGPGPGRPRRSAAAS